MSLTLKMNREIRLGVAWASTTKGEGNEECRSDFVVPLFRYSEICKTSFAEQ